MKTIEELDARTLTLRLNNLRRKVVIQNYYLDYMRKHPGTTFVYVWRYVIYPEFFIGQRNLHDCLKQPVKKQLRQLEEYLKQQPQPCEELHLYSPLQPSV